MQRFAWRAFTLPLDFVCNEFMSVPRLQLRFPGGFTVPAPLVRVDPTLYSGRGIVLLVWRSSSGQGATPCTGQSDPINQGRICASL